MTLKITWLPALLALGLLLWAGNAAAERIQRSTDQQGTIHIGNAPAAGQEKAGDQKTGSQPAEVKDQPPAATPAEPPPPGLLPSHSRRARFAPDGTVVPRPRSPLLSPGRPAPPPPRPGAPAPVSPARLASPAPESQ